jgi:HAD superfamily hydrolase (TIGR01490 family)
MPKRVVLCDFDGTLIKGDSLFMFIKYAKGNLSYFIGLFLLVPLYFLGILHIIKRQKLKEITLSYFFKGITLEEFNKISTNFVEVLSKRSNVDLLEKLSKYKNEGYEIYIVSASIDNWIRPWAHLHGIINVVSTQLEFTNEVFTGNFKTLNCNGIEKVKRVEELLGNRNNLYIISFGDSKGDEPMFKYSNEFYKIQL